MLWESGTVVLEARTGKDGRTVKKLLTLVLTCAFALSLIGCGDTKPTGAGTKPGGGGGGAPAPAPGGGSEKPKTP
jgi:hypothetical protein